MVMPANRHKKQRELTLFRSKGTGIPDKQNRQATLYMHTACALRHSSCLSKITSFLLQDVQRTYNLYNQNPLAFKPDDEFSNSYANITKLAGLQKNSPALSHDKAGQPFTLHLRLSTW